jgi:hypothetical protein
MNTKTCTVCGETKEATTEFFYKMKTGKYGLRANCKVCRSLDRKKPVVYEFPASKVCNCCKKEFPATAEFFHKQNGGKYGLKARCKVCMKKPVVYEFPASKVCSCCGIEKPATSEHFYKMTRGKYGLQPKCKVCQVEYRAKPEVKQRTNERNKERGKTDIQFKLRKNLRGRLWLALAGKNKSASTLRLLGCTIEHLKSHLESQFTEGMSWDNYGLQGWEVDHIISIKSFDLTDPAQQRECFHFSNLQPLWAEDNRSKGAKLETVV